MILINVASMTIPGLGRFLFVKMRNTSAESETIKLNMTESASALNNREYWLCTIPLKRTHENGENPLTGLSPFSDCLFFQP